MLLHVQKISQLLSLCMYPVLYTVPTAGLLYLTSASASAWLTFRVLPSIRQYLQQYPAISKSPTTSTPPVHSKSAVDATTNQQPSLDRRGTEQPPAASAAPIASSSSSSGSGPLAATITTAASTLPALQGSSDLEYLVSEAILSHAGKRLRTSSPVWSHFCST